MINPNVIRENEFLWFLNRKVPAVTPIEMKQEPVRSNPEGGGELRGQDEDSMIVPARPSADLDMAELVACLVQLGHPPSCTGSARWMAELVVLSIGRA